MHETRNLVLIVLLIVFAIWAFIAEILLDPSGSLVTTQRIVAPTLLVLTAVAVVYGLWIEDKLPDYMRDAVGEVYFEVDGLDFMPTIRKKKDHAELCLYYQNRYENPAEVVVHLRPREDAFVIRPGARDVHFAFRAGGGDYGVIHQPIAVPAHLQGEVVEVEMGAASHYPRSHGAELRKHGGLPSGEVLVDWGGAAFKTGVHEVSGEIELKNPARVHLSLPKGVATEEGHDSSWRQECIAPGVRS